jgi:hypothetical protein
MSDIKNKEENYFIKNTAPSPGVCADSKLKAELNRKGNALLNSGDVEAARRVFITTGYSDGLIRVGDAYKKQKRPIDALRMYWAGHDRKKAQEIIMEAALLIKDLLAEDNTIQEKGVAKNID